MTEEQFEYLHDQGKVPDWWYYQRSNKPMWQKYQEQKDQFYREYEKQKKQENKNILEEAIINQAEEAIATAVKDLFIDFL